MFAKIARPPEVWNPREPLAAHGEQKKEQPVPGTALRRESRPGSGAGPWPGPGEERWIPAVPGVPALPGGCGDGRDASGAGVRGPGAAFSPRASAAVLPSTSPAMAAAQELRQGRAEPTQRRLASAGPALP